MFLAEENARHDVEGQDTEGDQQHTHPGQTLQVLIRIHREIENHLGQAGDRLTQIDTPELVRSEAISFINKALA